MHNKIPENLMNKIKAVGALMDKHNCVVHAMLISVGECSYRYKFNSGPKKNKYCEAAEERLIECRQIFHEAQKVFKENSIELLICLMSLKDGGVTVFVSKEATRRQLDIFNELKKMERYFAKTS